MKIYSYVLRYDDGAAPNPFWNVCTLTICKPVIRRKASVNDWVIGTGSKNAKCNDGKTHDLSGKLIYAMKITNRMSLAEYDKYCSQYLTEKIPDVLNTDWRRRMGDCIYKFAAGKPPKLREGVHNEINRKTDLSGLNALLSRHFYYFGENAVPLPDHFLPFVKQNQGHKIIENARLTGEFGRWIQGQGFKLNTVTDDPQMKHLFDQPLAKETLASCSSCHLAEDEIETEEVIC